jgi:hypothetical protein
LHQALLLILLSQAPTGAATAAPGQPPSAMPTDVALVVELFNLIDREAAATAPDSARLEAAFVRAVEAGCDAVLRETGVRDLAAGDRRALSDDILERVEGEFRAAFERPAGERWLALEELGRRATTRNLPAELVNRWLGFRDGPDAKAEGAKVQVEGGAVVSSQVTGAAGGGDLKLSPKESRLLKEVGGAGAGNGFIDAGEWVQLLLKVVNPSPRPWFSSSVSGRAEGACLWTPTHSAELAELPAVDGWGLVPLWVYLSRDCAGGARRLRLVIRDTHRSPVTEVELVASITPLEVPSPRMLGAYLDTDDLGSSDGSRRKELAPGLRFEFSLDLAVAGAEPTSVKMNYAAPQDLQPLFSKFTYRDVPLRRDGDRIHRAADDLDATVVGKAQYQAVMEAARASRRWVTGRRPARLWLAVDAHLQVARPGEPPAVESPRPPPPAPLAEEKLVALVRRHLTLAPHPVKPALPEALEAVAGYELVFDSVQFAIAYRALVWPPAPEAPEASPGTVPYWYRLYQPLSMVVIGAPEPVRPPAAPPAPAETRATPVAKPDAAPVYALDIGGTWTGYPAAAGVETSLFGSTALVDVGSISARLMFGTEVVGLFGLAYGIDGRTNDAAAAVHFKETTLAAGVGYAWHPDPAVDLVSRASLLLNFRSLRGSGSATTFGVELGLTLRGRLSDGFGLYADAGGLLGTAGPDDLVSGSGFRLGAGISFVF